jgi:hypothetical protein
LSEEQRATRKATNKKISNIRMKIEHVIGRVKNFKIVAEKYRNQRKRLLLRFNLICGIVNFQKLLLVYFRYYSIANRSEAIQTNP